MLVGNTQGGMAATCVVTCMFFAAVSGSSTATTFAIGAIMIPALVKAGYPRPWTASPPNSAPSRRGTSLTACAPPIGACGRCP
ncbi:MAG: TRAP transporter large permease subunit [Phreatobacter sp.]|nr:TRAP transporter large permease subunit [Phreatobacter sp.]